MISKETKTKGMKVAVKALNGGLSFLYFFLKLRPTRKGKVLFCSRKFDEPSIDFELLKEAIYNIMPDATIVGVYDHIKPTFPGYIHFGISTLRSMWHLANANVCVLDSYWPAVSMLRHKPKLKVIQMWHSIGKMKKSGYQSLNKKAGRNGAMASVFKMHRNYDYVIGGAEFWNQYYEEAFDVKREQILNYGLPCIDYLLAKGEKSKIAFLREFKEAEGKKIVLYAPTFRRKMKVVGGDIIKAANRDDIIIVIKNHPEQWTKDRERNNNLIYLEEWKTMDLLGACDYLITDYSSIALEAAVLKKKTFFWTYDYEEYMRNSGTNIDLKSEVPKSLSCDINWIMDQIENDIYNEEEQKRYISKFLPKHLGGSANLIAQKIISLMEE